MRLTPQQKLKAAETREETAAEGLRIAAIRYAKHPRWFIQLIAAARDHTNSANAVGRARRELSKAYSTLCPDCERVVLLHAEHLCTARRHSSIPQTKGTA